MNRAWCEGILICGFVDPHEPKYPVAIAFRRPGESCGAKHEEREEREQDSPLERLEHVGKRLLFGKREEPEKREHDG